MLTGVSLVEDKVSDTESQLPGQNDTASYKSIHSIENTENHSKLTESTKTTEKDIKHPMTITHSVTKNIDLNHIQNSIPESKLKKSSENHHNGTAGETCKISDSDNGPLSQTPLPAKTMDKLSSGKSAKSQEFVGRELRSRNKNTKPIIDETSNDTNSVEQLTPDPVTDTASLFEHNQAKTIHVVKTYGKRNSFKQDKEASKKVSEWLKSVPLKTNVNNKKTKDILNGELEERKIQKSKKGLKLKTDEEKMGQKLKHLAESLHVDSGVNDNCFGFDDNESKNNITGTKYTDIADYKTAVTKDEVMQINSANISISELTVNEQIFETEIIADETSVMQQKEIRKMESEISPSFRTKSGDIDMKNCSIPLSTNKVDLSESNVLLNKRQLFKSRVLNKKNSSSGVENEIVINHDNCTSDPYEFKSSQNTPKKAVKKKGKLAKVLTKKNNKGFGKVILEQEMLKKKNHSKKILTTVPRRSRSNNRPEIQQMAVVDCTLLPCTQNEIEQLSSKINQAEDYDLLTCTQEAADSFEKNSHIPPMKGYLKDEHVIQPACLARTDTSQLELKSSQQKKVRFREPVISDFIHSGKIDILGYRKAKEIMKTTEGNTAETEDKILGSEAVVRASDRLEEAVNAVCHEDGIDNNEKKSIACKDTSVCSPKSINDTVVAVPEKKEIEITETKTDVRVFCSPSAAFKNPMMTPTMLKSTTAVLERQCLGE